MRSETMLESFKISLIIGLLATVLALLVGVPASYALARYSVKGKNLIKSFFLSPTVIPGIVVGYTLFQFIVVALGLPVFQGLLIGHFLISLPYIIRVVGSSMDQLDYSIEEVAWTLGCTRFRAFMQIVLPNVSSGIFAAFMLAFVNSFNNVPVSMFLSGPGVTMLPTSLLSYMEYNYDPTVSAISVMLMLLTIGLMYLIEKTLGLASIA
ncbi:spermidine/putrescine ABC transporter permease [Enterococcus saccharolyticus subsp. saccharolyticus ATCC 43076]|uniref:Spermidine/putrescine ABC transporter permease n=1 Tax=Enterococcus saccharolyticus subsp. saccharolyticus ATCC 43076 TaxID=1139996 RepID=S0NSQ9_9ENTE|nr:spermidine/putrescine ABC transporter permease [Enterococcus saccharolyticus subsp. saccharolyticus ATCC 43076]EOT80940.1 spermidine/putrescine ABC transporter permease [Enterococcus saccharolyticus subsp. saccharolyticus ATCC 43076]OJG89601.1 spermidine/putrescine ABC transporter permease [Enterococcus saccharolyticus]